MTKDKKLVVFHDDTLDRTTNGKGKISEFTHEQLSKFDAGQGEGIPLLSQVLDLFVKHEKKLFIEYKEPNCEQDCLAIVTDWKMIDQVNMISFHFDILKNIRKLNENVTLGLLMREAQDLKSISQELMATKISNIGLAYTALNPDFIKLANSYGIHVWTWNPRDESQVHRALDFGVIGMGSDNIKMTQHAYTTWKRTI